MSFHDACMLCLVEALVSLAVSCSLSGRFFVPILQDTAASIGIYNIFHAFLWVPCTLRLPDR